MYVRNDFIIRTLKKTKQKRKETGKIIPKKCTQKISYRFTKKKGTIYANLNLLFNF